MVFLAGWGDTAHVFDKFAPQFSRQFHVYGITREGFGGSSKAPPTPLNFDADRLADDDVAVFDALKLDHLILVGHSLAGQEMSSIATRYPRRVSKLVYLEAAYSFAFYDSRGGDTIYLEADTLRRELEDLVHADNDLTAQRKIIGTILGKLPNLQWSLQQALSNMDGLPNKRPRLKLSLFSKQSDAMMMGSHQYVAIKTPFLAIIAAPYACRPDCDAPGEKAWADTVDRQANAVERDYPQDTILRIPNASHRIFESNERAVVEAMQKFLR